jgi:hypothetical protein
MGSGCSWNIDRRRALFGAMENNMHNDQDGAPHLDKVEARAGSRTKVNRNILVISLALALIGMAAVIGFGFFGTDRTGADQVNAENGAVANVASPPSR